MEVSHVPNMLMWSYYISVGTRLKVFPLPVITLSNQTHKIVLHMQHGYDLICYNGPYGPV